MHNIDEVQQQNKIRITKKQEYYSSPLSLTSQFYFCPVPLRLDTYSGCSHGCIYCFANNSMQKFIGSEEFSKENIYENVKPTKYEYVKKYFDIAFEGAKNTFNNQEALAVQYVKEL
jgi:DNA repair photolyase